MNIPLEEGYLLIRGGPSFLLVGKAVTPFILFIETTRGEVCQAVDANDLVVISAPEGGDITQAMMLLELVRTYHQPLVVLPKEHPGSHRLRMVISVGPETVTDCQIERGTHPEQYLICSSDELAGIHLKGEENGIRIIRAQENVSFEYLPQLSM
jgi:hypothetical protein